MTPDGQERRGCLGMTGSMVAVVLLLLGIVVPLLVAPAGAALIFLIVTIPLYAVLAVLPTLCIIGLGALFFGRLMRQGALFYVAGAAVAIAALVVVPHLSNPVLHDKARALISGDRLTIPAPVRTGSIALVHRAPSGERPRHSLCGDLCRTLLLDGRAKTVLIVPDAKIASGFKPDLASIAYTLENRPSCPDTGAAAYDLPGEATSTPIGQSSAERLNLAMAQGQCLVARKARSGDAEVAVLYGDMAVRKATRARWFSGDPFTVRRISQWRRNGTAFTETYRHTYVAYDVYFPILAPTILLDGTRSYAGFARNRVHARTKDRWVSEPPVAEVVLGPRPKLTPGGPGRGLTLAPEAGLIDQSRQILGRALDSTEAPSSAVLAVADSYIDGVAWNRRDLTPADAVLATRLLSDARFPVSGSAAGFIKTGSASPGQLPVRAGAPSPAQTSAIARSMFARLHAMEATLPAAPDTGGKDAGVKRDFSRARMGGITSDQFEQASAIGGVIAELPAMDILRHRTDLLWLARQRAVRAPAYRALSRLDLVSDGQVFLYLIDDSGQFANVDRDAPGDDRYRQHPYLAGIQGLCAMGDTASRFRPDLIARIRNGTVGRDGSYGEIAFNTLVAMGTPREELQRLFKGSSNFVHVTYTGGGLSGPRRKVTQDISVDRDYARALKRQDCGY